MLAEALEEGDFTEFENALDGLLEEGGHIEFEAFGCENEIKGEYHRRQRGAQEREYGQLVTDPFIQPFQRRGIDLID